MTKNLFNVFFLALISLSLLITVGCEDDEGDDGPDPIIGTWVLDKAEVFGVDVKDTYGIAATIVVNEDKTFTADFTMPDPETFTPINVTQEGTWERIDDSTVSITYSDPFTQQQVTENLSKEGEYYTTTKSMEVTLGSVVVKLFLVKQ